MRRVGWAVVAAVVAAAAVFVLLRPFTVQTSDPPRCWSQLGFEVPCGSGSGFLPQEGLAAGAAVVAAGLVLLGWALGRAGRRGGSRR